MCCKIFMRRCSPFFYLKLLQMSFSFSFTSQTALKLVSPSLMVNVLQFYLDLIILVTSTMYSSLIPQSKPIISQMAPLVNSIAFVVMCQMRMVGVRLCGYRSVQLQRSQHCCCVLVWYLQKGACVISSLIIRINKNRQYWRMNSKGNYKTYCFEHLGNIMFFYYNHNHPIMMKNYKFELGKVKIFTESGMVFNCQITSNPHLNIVLDWNEEYFAKLFHGLSIFELQLTVDQCEEITSLVVRDHFQKEEEIFLMRAKLILQPGFDKINEFWTTFKNYNLEKIKGIENMQKEGAEMRGNADEQLMKLMHFQEGKQVEKRKLKGQISALLRQKQAKLRQFNESFNYYGQNKQIQPSYDLSEQKDSQSIAGSLFQESQQFIFQN